MMSLPAGLRSIRCLVLENLWFYNRGWWFWPPVHIRVYFCGLINKKINIIKRKGQAAYYKPYKKCTVLFNGYKSLLYCVICNANYKGQPTKLWQKFNKTSQHVTVTVLWRFWAFLITHNQDFYQAQSSSSFSFAEQTELALFWVNPAPTPTMEH